MNIIVCVSFFWGGVSLQCTFEELCSHAFGNGKRTRSALFLMYARCDRESSSRLLNRPDTCRPASSIASTCGPSTLEDGNHAGGSANGWFPPPSLARQSLRRLRRGEVDIFEREEQDEEEEEEEEEEEDEEEEEEEEEEEGEEEEEEVEEDDEEMESDEDDEEEVRQLAARLSISGGTAD